VRGGGTHETSLCRAFARAAITVQLIAIIAGFVWIDIPVSACGRARLGVARAVKTTRFLGACLRAARIVGISIEQAVLAPTAGWQLGRIVATVALLARLFDSVAALRHFAKLAWGGTVGARLSLAGGRAAITTGGIAVVAHLTALDLAVATDWGAGLSWHATLPPGIDRLAVCRAAITTYGIAVVAGLVGSQHAVATLPLIDARLAGRRTNKVGFDQALSIAAGINGMVGIEFRGRKDAVVAVLALVQFTVAAGLGRDEGALSRSTAAGTATGGITNNAGRTAAAGVVAAVAPVLSAALLLIGNRGAGAARCCEQSNRARQD